MSRTREALPTLAAEASSPLAKAQFKDLAQTWMRSASGDLAGKLYSVTHEGGLF